jgi:hypothetical protein
VLLLDVMSYHSSRRKALDATEALSTRASAARSCALLVAQKYRERRSTVLAIVLRRCGVDLESVSNEDEITKALGLLDQLRCDGLKVS